MEKFEVSKEFILEAYGAACEGWQEKLKAKFPEAFRGLFDKGKWYINAKNLKAMFFYNGATITDKGCGVGHGFMGCGGWTNDFYLYKFDVEKYRLATPEEIKSHLIKEAERRGFKKGVKVDRSCFKNVKSWHVSRGTADVYSDGWHYADDDSLMIGGYGIYHKGVWAEIIPSVKELTMQEIADKFCIPVSELKIKKD